MAAAIKLAAGPHTSRRDRQRPTGGRRNSGAGSSGAPLVSGAVAAGAPWMTTWPAGLLRRPVLATLRIRAAKLLGHTTSRMVELVYDHLNDATTIAAITKLPAPAAPALADPATRTAALPTRRRRSVAGEAPTLNLVTEDAAASAPAEPIPRWRSRAGRAQPRPGSGSQSVVRPLRNERPERRMRQPESQSSSEVTVPRVGIEPTTRGFSVRCSTN
jgi:hypothetical protein